MTVIRLGDPQDEEQVMHLCRMIHAEAGQHPFVEDKVRHIVRRGLDRDRSIIGVIGGEPGSELYGCICLLLDGVWYSDEYQLLELFNFVHPDHRKSTYAQDLINYAKKCADELGIDLTIGVIANERMAAKVRLYGRLLPKAGEFFIYKPKMKGDEDGQ